MGLKLSSSPSVAKPAVKPVKPALAVHVPGRVLAGSAPIKPTKAPTVLPEDIATARREVLKQWALENGAIDKDVRGKGVREIRDLVNKLLEAKKAAESLS